MKTQLNDFLGALAAQNDPLGLIVTAGKPAALEFGSDIARMETFEIDSATDPDAVIEFLSAMVKQKQWCRLNLQDGSLPGKIYNQLRSLATTGHLQIVDEKGEVTDLRWTKESKVVVVVNAKIVERIAIPTFLNLFGPILRLV